MLVDGTRFFFRYSLMFSHSNLFSFLFSLLLLSIGCDSVPYISSSKSGSVSGFLVLSHSFQNVQSCTRNHSAPQIIVSVVRQTAHNMHTACITSCIHVTKNSNNALTTAGFTLCLAHAIITFSGFVTSAWSAFSLVLKLCPPAVSVKDTSSLCLQRHHGCGCC